MRRITIKQVINLVASVLVLFGSGHLYSGERFQATSGRVQRMDNLATAFFERGQFNGSILVALEGKTVFERGFGQANIEWNIPNTPNTVFNLASMSKQFTAMAIMLLVEHGDVDLDKPITGALSWLRADLGKRITIRQLLTHTAGLPDEPLSPLERHLYPLRTREDLRAAINRIELVFKPGARFSYSNVGYNLLALVVEARSGMDFGEFLQTRIFRPLGMTQTSLKGPHDFTKNRAQGFWVYSGAVEREEGIADDIELMGPGNVFSSVRDLLKWDQALYQNTLLSEGNTKLMFTPHKGDYGFGWRICPNFYQDSVVQRLVEHTGRAPGSATHIMRFLDDRLLVVMLGNTQRSAEPLAIGLVNILAGEKSGPEEAPKPTYEDELLRVILSQGVEAAITQYRAAKQDGSYRMPGTGGINRLAYQLLRSGRVDQAKKLFQVFMALAPTTSIAYDGYAETLALAGDKTQSIRFYRKSLEFDLTNVSALRALKIMGVANPTRLLDPLLRTILDRGPGAGLKKYRSLPKLEQATIQAKINAVAFNLIRNGRPREAMPLFTFNTLAFPNSWNTWDSLAEARQKIENKVQALHDYRKSLVLNPGNKNAHDQIRLLEAVLGVTANFQK
jgi:CubicO group peptidase (beta-lactamase class C family)